MGLPGTSAKCETEEPREEILCGACCEAMNLERSGGGFADISVRDDCREDGGKE